MGNYSRVAEFKKVTPKQARLWLESNTKNRNVIPHHVSKLATEIKSGRWVANGETIKIATDGTLIDGQHRLSAIVQANAAIETLVVTNLPETEAAQYTVDAGAKRSLGHALKIREEHYASELGSALNVLWRFTNGYLLTNYTPSTGAALELLDEHPDIREATAHANRLRMAFPFRPSITAWGIYTMSTISRASLSMNDDEGLNFWEQLPNGVIGPVGTPTTDPLGHLRNMIQREKRELRTRYSPAHMTALVIKAWNAYANNEEIRLLRWSPNAREPFPELVGQSELEDLGWFDRS